MQTDHKCEGIFLPVLDLLCCIERLELKSLPCMEPKLKLSSIREESSDDFMLDILQLSDSESRLPMLSEVAVCFVCLTTQAPCCQEGLDGQASSAKDSLSFAIHDALENIQALSSRTQVSLPLVWCLADLSSVGWLLR